MKTGRWNCLANHQHGKRIQSWLAGGMDRSWHTQGSITKDLTSCDLGNITVEGNAVVGVTVQAFEKIRGGT